MQTLAWIPRPSLEMDVVTQELYDQFNVIVANLASLNKCGVGMWTKTKEHEVNFKTSKHSWGLKLPKSTN
jgi:hypothetical protein